MSRQLLLSNVRRSTKCCDLLIQLQQERSRLSTQQFLTLRNQLNQQIINLIIALNNPPNIQNIRPLKNVRYIASDGNDINTSTSGSIAAPFKTINYALSQITTASSTNRFELLLAPGIYNENITLKPNINITGIGDNTVTVNGNIDMNNSTWGTSVDAITTLKNLIIPSGFNVILDFALFGSITGRVIFDTMQSLSPISITMNNNTSQMIFFDSSSSDIVTQQGGQVVAIDSIIQTMNMIGSPISQTQLLSVGSTFSNFNATTTITDFLLSVEATHSGIRIINATGPNTLLNLDATSMPQAGNLLLSLGSSVNRTSDAGALAYIPSDLSNWTPTPETVQGGLDQIANSNGIGFIPFVVLSPTVTSISTFNLNFMRLGKMIMCTFIIIANTSPASPITCSILFSLPIARNSGNFVITQEANGSFTIAGVPASNATGTYTQLQANVGTQQISLQWDQNGVGHPTTIQISGSFSYSL
jgi:hypothetical protein